MLDPKRLRCLSSKPPTGNDGGWRIGDRLAGGLRLGAALYDLALLCEDPRGEGAIGHAVLIPGAGGWEIQGVGSFPPFRPHPRASAHERLERSAWISAWTEALGRWAGSLISLEEARSAGLAISFSADPWSCRIQVNQEGEGVPSPVLRLDTAEIHLDAVKAAVRRFGCFLAGWAGDVPSPKPAAIPLWEADVGFDSEGYSAQVHLRARAPDLRSAADLIAGRALACCALLLGGVDFESVRIGPISLVEEPARAGAAALRRLVGKSMASHP